MTEALLIRRTRQIACRVEAARHNVAIMNFWRRHGDSATDGFSGIPDYLRVMTGHRIITGRSPVIILLFREPKVEVVGCATVRIVRRIPYKVLTLMVRA